MRVKKRAVQHKLSLFSGGDGVRTGRQNLVQDVKYAVGAEDDERGGLTSKDGAHQLH